MVAAEFFHVPVGLQKHRNPDHLVKSIRGDSVPRRLNCGKSSSADGQIQFCRFLWSPLASLSPWRAYSRQEPSSSSCWLGYGSHSHALSGPDKPSIPGRLKRMAAPLSVPCQAVEVGYGPPLLLAFGIARRAVVLRGNASGCRIASKAATKHLSRPGHEARRAHWPQPRPRYDA
jgi:hypothetical protein